MWLINSSIGRKLIMSLTGAFLILFVTFHCLMNAVAIFWPAAYNVVCAFLGANWYALVGTLILAAGVVLHIVYACWLTIQNRRARGNDRYAVTSRPKQVEWSSKNMLVLGIVILCFLVIHLIQFWAKMQLQEIMGQAYETCQGEVVPPAAGTWFLQIIFGQWWTLPVYVIGFIALWFHMNHGFWSMFQSAGINNDKWIPRFKAIGCWWTTIVIGLFLVEAVVFTVEANNGAYTECPVLQEQYQEMLQEHQNAIIPGQSAEMGACEHGCAHGNAHNAVGVISGGTCHGIEACSPEMCPDQCADCPNPCGDNCATPNCSKRKD